MLEFLRIAGELLERSERAKNACPRNYAVLYEEASIREDAEALFDLITDTPMFASGGRIAVQLAQFALELQG